MNKRNYSVADTDIEIKPEIQKEYIKYHDKFVSDSYSEEEIDDLEATLFGKSLSEKEKRKILFRLAHTHEMKAYELLKWFYEISRGDLKQWTAFCLNECRMWVMSDSFNEDQAMIFSGAGSDGQRMRHYTVVTTNNWQSFSKSDKKTLEKVTHVVCEQKLSRLESIEFDEYYAVISIMQSPEVALDEIMVEIMKQCKSFLRYHYYATNLRKPNDEDINEYIELLKNEEGDQNNDI